MPNHLKVKNISHIYGKHKDLPVLDNITFNVGPGEIVGIVGPSGCGKTTLAHIIGGFINPTGGNVFIGNKEVDKPGMDRAVISQEYDIFDWRTVWGNIELAARQRKTHNKNYAKICQYFIDLVNLTGFENIYPKFLSGGMKKRLALARSLALGSNFIIMDEPFSSLDYQTREKLHYDILNISSVTRKAIIVITHDIEEALLLSQRVLILSKRPAMVKKIIKVELARTILKPDKTSKEFQQLRRKIQQLLKDSEDRREVFRSYLNKNKEAEKLKKELKNLGYKI